MHRRLSRSSARFDRRLTDSFDARSLATLISTGANMSLPLVWIIDPGVVAEGRGPGLIAVWTGIAFIFCYTAWVRRLNDLEVGIFGVFGIWGTCATAWMIADPRAAQAVLALVAVIPAIAALSPSRILTPVLVTCAVAAAALLVTVTTERFGNIVITLGATIALITVPVFLVIVLRQSLVRTVRRQAELSGLDPLTGLLNRRGFFSRAPELLTETVASARWAGILILDLDHFKKVNDERGHVAGDEVLVTAAHALRQAAPKGSVLCRFGGEEFLAFCVVRDTFQLHSIGERFRHAVFGAADVTVSIGGVCAPIIAARDASRNGSTTDIVTDLIRIADRSVYQAKEAGRNKVITSAVDALVWRGIDDPPAPAKAHPVVDPILFTRSRRRDSVLPPRR